MANQIDRNIGIAGLIITIGGYVATIVALPADQRMVGYVITGVLLGLSLLSIAFYFGRMSVSHKNIIDVEHPTEKQFADILIGFFERKKTDNENEEIIRLGTALSTPLWLSQNYGIRKIIGEYLEEAARKTHNIPIKIKTLIDDLGWTNVELGDYEEAEKRINHGIQLSVEHDNGYYLAKGHRHLFGLYYRTNKPTLAEKHLKIAIEKTEVLHPDNKKNELVAEIHYAKSSWEFYQGNLDNSLKEVEIAFEKYSRLPNKEWSIKLMARKAEVLLKRGDVYQAKEIFKNGLSNSKDFHFNKQIVVNLIGLGNCAYEEKELANALKYYEEALIIAEEIGMFYEKGIINSHIEKINNKM